MFWITSKQTNNLSVPIFENTPARQPVRASVRTPVSVVVSNHLITLIYVKKGEGIKEGKIEIREKKPKMPQKTNKTNKTNKTIKTKAKKEKIGKKTDKKTKIAKIAKIAKLAKMAKIETKIMGSPTPSGELPSCPRPSRGKVWSVNGPPASGLPGRACATTATSRPTM